MGLSLVSTIEKISAIKAFEKEKTEFEEIGPISASRLELP